MATQLARKAEALLTVALTMQLVASVACGHGRHLLRAEPESTAGAEVDFALQHPGLASTPHHRRDARAMQAEREAEAAYQDWNQLQDSYEAEMRLHSERLAVTSAAGDVQLRPALPAPATPQHTVVHRPLYIDAAVPSRDEEDDATEQEDSEPENQLSHEGEPEAQGDGEASAAEPSREDIHSSKASVVSAVATAGKRRHRFARRLLFVPQPEDQLQRRPGVGPDGRRWPTLRRQLHRQPLSAPFGAMGLFSAASDPAELSSSASAP